MDAASIDAAGFDFDDLGFLDGLECFDLDLLPADFFLAGPGKEGYLDLDLGSAPDDDGGRESSPDSVVTDDGGRESSSGDRGDDGGEMSDYVDELERFLMEEDHDVVSVCPTMAEDRDLAADAAYDDDYFFGGYFGADDGCAELAPGAETTGAEEEELGADDYFLDDIYYVGDDAYAGAAVEGAVSAEELDTNGEHFFGGDYHVTDNEVYAEPAAMVDPASPVPEEDDFAAAREDDETASRKRARYE